MENYQYKNHLVEIFTAKIEEKWTFVFIIDGRVVDAIRDPAFDSHEVAAEMAKVEAERLIDREVGCGHAGAV